LNYPLLRMAADVLRQGAVRYPRRRVGIAYDCREFSVSFAHRRQVDFWACDAAALPFSPGTFSLAVGLNVLDCVASPTEFLASLERVLRTGGSAIISCPYDWSPAATPVEAWLGGHSQRSPVAGASEPVLRMLLTPGGHPSARRGLELVDECELLPWHVRLHARSTMTYQVHLVVVERRSATASR
jgi:SAM-dependent methyltransferase